jgi:hypothetical protein
LQNADALPLGLIPFSAKADIIPKLIIKVSKETILTAKIRQEFLIHLIPYEVDGVHSVGFLAAFSDDSQSPLVSGGAFIREFFARELSGLFLSKQVDVHFFDELGREMLGYRTEFTSTKKHRNLLRAAIFPSLNQVRQGAVLNALSEWFSRSSIEDDKTAIAVEFKYSLLPEDMVFVDMRHENHSYHGSAGYSFVTLEREEPGEAQEKEIVELLHRTFDGEGIYLSPKRDYDKEEIADILVVTERSVLIVQAKDSPNIERIVNNSIERKRSTANGALKKAVGQVKGAIGYLNKSSPVGMLIDGKEVKIDLQNKKMYGLVVMKELFNDDYDEYTPPMIELYGKTSVPCIPLSYSELHQYTRHLKGDEAFFEAFLKVFLHGLESGMFPRLRLHPPGSNI